MALHWWQLLTSRSYREERREERRLKKLMDLCHESSEPVPLHLLEVGQADRPMQLKDVFRVHETKKEEMSGENRVLLWHGSRLCNVGGITSNGLLIRPKGVPTNGARHGHGMYFADMSSKAAHYCGHTRMGEEGVLFLFEVALGKIQEEREESKEAMPLREGFNSRKALGRHYPDPDGDRDHPDGYRMALGQAMVEGEFPREFNE